MTASAVYCVSSVLGAAGDTEDGSREATASCFLGGLELGGPHPQATFDECPGRSNDSELGNLELHFQNRKAFVNKTKNPVFPSTLGQLGTSSWPRAGCLSFVSLRLLLICAMG